MVHSFYLIIRYKIDINVNSNEEPIIVATINENACSIVTLVVSYQVNTLTAKNIHTKKNVFPIYYVCSTYGSINDSCSLYKCVNV